MMYYRYMKNLSESTTYQQDSSTIEREREEGDFLLQLNGTEDFKELTKQLGKPRSV